MLYYIKLSYNIIILAFNYPPPPSQPSQQCLDLNSMVSTTGKFVTNNQLNLTLKPIIYVLIRFSLINESRE